MDMITAYVPRPSSDLSNVEATQSSHNTNKLCTPTHPTTIAEYPYATRFRDIATQMADLYAKKNADYGNSFAETVDKLGYAAALARIYDKWNRLCQLSQHAGQGAIKEESMLDTAIDGACYFIMLAMEIERSTTQLQTTQLTNSCHD